MSCQIWGTSGFKWGEANWRWSECGPIRCFVWGTANVLWKNADWKWSECQGGTPTPPIPPIPPIPVIIIGNRPGVDATMLISPWAEEEQWNPYKAGDEERKRKRRIVELICKTDSGNYSIKKELKNVTVEVDKVKLSIKDPPKIDLKIT